MYLIFCYQLQMYICKILNNINVMSTSYCPIYYKNDFYIKSFYYSTDITRVNYSLLHEI